MGNQLEQFLDQKYINLETYKMDGTSIRTPVWFVIDKDLIYVITRDSTGKVKRLKHNQDVRIVPCSFKGEPKNEWVKGKAEKITEYNIKNNSTPVGLGSYWGEVLDVLQEIIPVYDKVNSYISFGKDSEHRNRAIKGKIQNGDKILDAGSGFGNMSKTALDVANGEVEIMLYDPLLAMIKNTDRLFKKKPEATCGVFEHVPFKDQQFDVVLSGYSLRDAISLNTAISEIHRVLKKGGKWIIVDLGKPDEPIARFGVSFYLRLILPIVAYAAGGRLGLKFAKLYGTYRLWPENKKLESKLLEKFTSVEFEKDLMGGAIMVAAYK